MLKTVLYGDLAAKADPPPLAEKNKRVFKEDKDRTVSTFQEQMNNDDENENC